MKGGALDLAGKLPRHPRGFYVPLMVCLFWRVRHGAALQYTFAVYAVRVDFQSAEEALV